LAHLRKQQHCAVWGAGAASLFTWSRAQGLSVPELNYNPFRGALAGKTFEPLDP
jgi:hypothetical protein